MGSRTSTAVIIEKKFDDLSNITDQVALMNSVHGGDVELPIKEMGTLIAELKEWNLDKLSVEDRRSYLSHMSFHREIIAAIIDEARSLVIERYRQHLKTLVAYHKGFSHWLRNVERYYRQ